MRTLIVSQETVIGALKETINRVDGDQQTLFTDFRSVDKRLYELERDTGQELIKVRKSIREQIEEAASKPTSGTIMAKQIKQLKRDPVKKSTSMGTGEQSRRVKISMSAMNKNKRRSYKAHRGQGR